MRWSLFLIILLGLSCKSLSETEKLHQTLSGRWLIVAPEHHLKNGHQEIVYAHIQDSIVVLSGLKLISLFAGGSFQQIDSAGKNGKWGITTDNIVFIENGGRGFDNFSAHFKSYKNGTLELTQFIEAEDERIELVWNLKKVNSSYTSKLFDPSKNEWRKKPGTPETEKQMKERLSAMLQYYSDYYHLVTSESGFFIPTRVLLPFTFYQHAMGVKSFDEESFFASLFYDKEQARQGWQYLKTTFTWLKYDFPREKDYVEEYAEFMEMMAKQITRE